MMRVPGLNTLARIVCLIGFGVIAAAASAETSHDGLERRENAGGAELWVRKFLDVRSYDQIIYEPPHIEYRPTAKSTGAQSTFPVSQRQQDSLYEIVSAAFLAELGKSKFFKLTTEPGPHALVVRGNLLDVVSFVPPQSNGPNDLLVADVGEATLVLELFDSESGAIVVRAIERVTAKHEGTAPGTAADAVQRTALGLAIRLRERLDAAASIPRNE